MDQIQFWQTTAAQLIGDTHFTAGVKPLVTVLLTPTKKDLTFPVRLALHKMPKEAEPVLISALKAEGDFGPLAAAYPEKAYVSLVAEPLAYISRPAGLAAVLDAINSADNDGNRVMLSSYLTYWPPEPRSLKAFTDTASKIAPNAAVALAGGMNGHAVLAGNAAGFFEPSLTDWVVKEIQNAKGEGIAESIQSSGSIAAIKLMQPESMKSVGDTINAKIQGQATEKDMFKAASAVVDKCKKDVTCYMNHLSTPIPSAPAAAKMGHVKAVWMIAMNGNEGDKAKLFDKLSTVKDRSVRLPICEAIDHLSPKGDAAMGDKLEKLVDSEVAAGNKDGTDEMYRIALKLRSRVP
jgi:hypothetical protein